MSNKLKLVVELNNTNEMEELVQLVTKQVEHLWIQWDKRSTPEQKKLMETIHKNPGTLPEDFRSLFKNESEMAIFMFRSKEYYWQYVNAFERLKDLQKAYDKFNYSMPEPFAEKNYGLHWEA